MFYELHVTRKILAYCSWLLRGWYRLIFVLVAKVFTIVVVVGFLYFL